MIGWVSSALLVGWVAMVCARGTRRLQVAAPLVAIGLGSLPLVAGGSALGWLRGAIGDLSIPTLVLLADSMQRRVRGLPVRTRTRAVLLAGAAALAPLFYPPTLGICPYDPYAAGFGSRGLPLAVLAATALLWWRRREPAALVLFLAVAAWQLRVGESDNLWDYLYDPLLAVFGLLWLLTRPLARARQRRSRRDGDPRPATSA